MTASFVCYIFTSGLDFLPAVTHQTLTMLYNLGRQDECHQRIECLCVVTFLQLCRVSYCYVSSFKPKNFFSCWLTPLDFSELDELMCHLFLVVNIDVLRVKWLTMVSNNCVQLQVIMYYTPKSLHFFYSL